MRKIALSLLSVVALIFSIGASADDFKLGIIDVRQALQKSPQVIAMQKDLQNQFGARDKQLQAGQQQLQQDIDNLNKNGSVMSANDRAALIKKTQTEQQNLRNMQVSFQKDLYAKQNQQMQAILAQMQTVVAQIAKAKNLNLVVTKDAVAFAANELDITNDVIEAMQKAK